MDLPKVYEFAVRLGVGTTTLDAEGEGRFLTRAPEVVHLALQQRRLPGLAVDEAARGVAADVELPRRHLRPRVAVVPLLLGSSRRRGDQESREGTGDG